MKKLKIAFLCEFSAGADGVWNRVYNIAKILAKRHEVYVLSSNITKGTEEIAKAEEEIDKIKIYRFPVKFQVGENTLFWNFEDKLKEIRPDIIDTHVFRHPHSNKVPKIAKQIGAKCFLTTHAPFVEKELRSPLLNLVVSLYDKFKAKRILNSYDKVIAITKWEIPYLEKLGCEKEKIVYIPNGIPDEFFKIKNKPRGKEDKAKTILFFGRVAPIKNLEILIKAYKIILEKKYKVKLKIVGPAEKGYKQRLLDIVNQSNVNVEFLGAIYDLKQKIKIVQDSDIFVLPSKREASPQALIEAMAFGKIVISSATQGGKEIIKDDKNGFLFEIGNVEHLAKKIAYCLDNSSSLERIRKEAKNSVKSLVWSKIAKNEESLIM